VRLRGAAVVALSATAVIYLRAQSRVVVDEWRAYGGNLANTHYSSGSQITADNVRNLKVVWRQSLTPDEVKQGRGWTGHHGEFVALTLN
jgi:glucose dehydrogenase